MSTMEMLTVGISLGGLLVNGLGWLAVIFKLGVASGNITTRLDSVERTIGQFNPAVLSTELSALKEQRCEKCPFRPS